MKKRGWGRIVNITSEAAFRGSERMWDYGAAKGGIVTFTRSLAIEVGRFGVTVNAVGPGLTRTAAYDALPPEIRAASETGIPTGHPGEPEDVAHAVAFFASEGARHINGQTLLVNGGTWLL
jgi:acetoacetyl-CoA reductase/3-oxoacyl-[acyl-carrier protein] reductase